MEGNDSNMPPPAAMLLLNHGITLVEYGQSTMRKHGYPQVALKLEYVISDDKLQLASDLLEKNGFQSFSPDSILVNVYGDLESKGRYYTYPQETIPPELPVQLLPSSLVHVSVDNLDEKTSCGESDRAIRTLGLPQQCVSLIRTITNYPHLSPSRAKPLIELTALIAYGIFEYESHDKDWEWPEESEEQRQQKREFAIKKVRSWNISEDASYEQGLLESLIDGSIRIDDIPHGRSSPRLRI